jgi:hypothetical protein
MAIERTAENLANFCLSVVGAPYFFGTFGQVATRQLYNEKKAQYPQYYPPKSWTEASFVKDFGKRVCDCAGLLKWFLWSDNMSNKNPTYKAAEDWGATTFYNKCSAKGKISTLPANKVGLLVFNGNDSTKNHVGIIVDNSGTVVEAKGHAYGVIKSKASSWDYWGKCNLIIYDTQPQPEPPTPTDKYTVVTNSGDSLRLRAEPNISSKQVGYIPNGSTTIALEVVEGESIGGVTTWVKTRDGNFYDGFSEGYASGKYLSPTPEIKPEPAPKPQPVKKRYKVVTSSGDSLRIRAEANTDSKQVGYIEQGTIITVLGFVEGESIGGVTSWALTEDGHFYGDYKRGYASAYYLEEV